MNLWTLGLKTWKFAFFLQVSGSHCLKFVHFHIVVQLISVLVGLWISCTTTRKSPNSRIAATSVHQAWRKHHCHIPRPEFWGPLRRPILKWFRVIIGRTVTKLACGCNVEATSLLWQKKSIFKQRATGAHTKPLSLILICYLLCQCKVPSHRKTSPLYGRQGRGNRIQRFRGQLYTFNRRVIILSLEQHHGPCSTLSP